MTSMVLRSPCCQTWLTRVRLEGDSVIERRRTCPRCRRRWNISVEIRRVRTELLSGCQKAPQVFVHTLQSVEQKGD